MPPTSPCPAAGEAAIDCPWAAIGREAATDAHAVLARSAPAIVAQLARDATAPKLLAAWGAALNYNQQGGGFSADPIVAPPIVDELTALAGAAPRRDRVVHAGVQHTYGYLFSVLATPFGFKRARWVQPTINDGFGLPAGTIAPIPAAGTLLGNVTWLAGAIAFAGEPDALANAHSAPQLAAPAVRALDVAALHVQRLTETVEVAGRSVELRTDFVDFPHPVDANAAWLIYSVRDAGAARLISAFPITAEARDKYVAAPLGDAQPITTQYNAWVEGLTGQKLPGRRVRK
ncbi:MAG TPA: hypothetical protein VFP84_33640 [Kofleriaceae bacterium]|nr:hypothetical protein [Kofleriaceae bacterium]